MKYIFTFRSERNGLKHLSGRKCEIVRYMENAKSDNKTSRIGEAVNGPMIEARVFGVDCDHDILVNALYDELHLCNQQAC